jgi:putative holliday junction resolvase
MRTLAIDPGKKRIGLALSDAAGKLATPHKVIENTTPQESLKKIQKLIQDEQVERILIGLPLNMDGSPGPAAQNARNFGQQLSALTQLPIIYFDERLTSFQADEHLRTRKQAGEKLTRQKKKSRQDAHAAAVILQDFLDRQP